MHSVTAREQQSVKNRTKRHGNSQGSADNNEQPKTKKRIQPQTPRREVSKHSKHISCTHGHGPKRQCSATNSRKYGNELTASKAKSNKIHVEVVELAGALRATAKSVLQQRQRAPRGRKKKNDSRRTTLQSREWPFELAMSPEKESIQAAVPRKGPEPPVMIK